jgi:hypothetical protein
LAQTCLRRLKSGGCGPVERRIDLVVFVGNCFASIGEVGNHQEEFGLFKGAYE